ncbi:Uncharacterised protein [Bordetella pertussis]|nr:Uncharacterised protein [Bordetella pertussis]
MKRTVCGSASGCVSARAAAASSSELKPWRTTTWQVVQAQDSSQACSISIWLSSITRQIDTPLGASSMTAPSGQTSG